MKAKFYLLLFLISLAFGEVASFGQGYILYVRSNNSDQGFVDTLRYFGYDVQVKTGTYTGILETEKLDSANNAALIMISRNAATTAHGEGEDLATQWNLMEPPLISLSMWMIRNSRWQWINSASNSCEVGTPWQIAAGAEDDPAFDGVEIGADNFLEVFDTINQHSGDGLIFDDIGYGTLLATDNGGDAIVMARWDANLEFYMETAQYPANERVYYSVGTSDCGGSGGTSAVFNLNEAGLTILLNLVSEYIQTGSDIEEKTINTKKLSLYPNPVESILRVDYFSDYSGEAVLSMADMAGKVVHRETIDLMQGANNRYINVSSLAKGVYMLTLEYNDNQIVTKVIVK